MEGVSVTQVVKLFFDVLPECVEESIHNSTHLLVLDVAEHTPFYSQRLEQNQINGAFGSLLNPIKGLSHAGRGT